MSAEQEQPTPPPPAYFLSVTVANVRCFGPAQTLDLSDGEGRPAPWTVILGDNGTGKTTLLQAIAALEPREREFLERKPEEADRRLRFEYVPRYGDEERAFQKQYYRHRNKAPSANEGAEKRST